MSGVTSEYERCPVCGRFSLYTSYETRTEEYHDACSICGFYRKNTMERDNEGKATYKEFAAIDLSKKQVMLTTRRWNDTLSVPQYALSEQAQLLPTATTEDIEAHLQKMNHSAPGFRYNVEVLEHGKPISALWHRFAKLRIENGILHCSEVTFNYEEGGGYGFAAGVHADGQSMLRLLNSEDSVTAIVEELTNMGLHDIEIVHFKEQGKGSPETFHPCTGTQLLLNSDQYESIADVPGLMDYLEVESDV